MFVHDFGQFEHGDLIFATENGFQLHVAVDHSSVLLVLKVVLLDVVPDLFDDLRSGDGLGADHFRKGRAGSKRNHEGCVGFSLAGFLLGHRILSSNYGLVGTPHDGVRATRECVNQREKSTTRE